MSTSLETLPDELKLEIYQYLPSLFNLALTNRRSLQTTAVHLVQRAETPDSVPEAFRAIQYIIRFGNLPVSYLLNTSFEPFFSRFSDHVIDSLQNGSFEKAEAMLQALKQLPRRKRIPSEHLLKVLKVARDIIAQAIKDEDFRKAKAILKITKQRSCTRIMRKDFFLAPLKEVKEWLIQKILHGIFFDCELKEAIEAIQFMKMLPSKTKTSKKLFLDVVETGRDMIIQVFRNEQLHLADLVQADRAAQIIKGLLFNIIIPKNYFREVIERGKDVIRQALDNRSYEKIEATIRILRKLYHKATS